MTPAAKHGDPVVGVDIHLIQPPGPVPPVPIPHPHIGMVFDPADYAPIIGSTVSIGGAHRAQAGTAGYPVPHIPIGGVWGKPPKPEHENECFMGSSTVNVDGDAGTYAALPCLSCQCFGMVPPFRPKKASVNVSMVLPTSVVIPIPAGVMIGGPPTISLMALGFRAAFAGLGAFMKSKLGRRLAAAAKDKWRHVFRNMDSGFLKCKVLRAEPVDVVSGEVVVEQEDFVIQGRIPLQWTRRYGSHETRVGSCGHGWQTPADARLVVLPDNTVMFYDGSAGAKLFQGDPVDGPVRELVDGAVLSQHADLWVVRTKGGLIYDFPKPQPAEEKHWSPDTDNGVELLIERITDLCGNEWRFVRDDQGLKEIVEDTGRRIEVRSRNGRIEQMLLHHPDETKPRPLVRYEYDRDGDLTVVYDQLNAPYRFVYDNHCLTQHTNREGLSFYYEYDQCTPEGRCVHPYGDHGLYDYRFDYMPVINQTDVTDSLGNTSSVFYDEALMIVKEIDPQGGETTYEYDEVGRTTAVVDPADRRTEYAYDEHGNLLKVIRPDGVAVATQYNHQHKPVATTDPRGHEWFQDWDARGLLRKQATPTGSTTQYFYNERGDLTQIVDPRGCPTRFEVDALGHTTAVINALNQSTAFEVDALGNVTRSTDPLGHATTYRYDAKSRLIERTSPAGRTIRARYDRDDNLTEYHDEAGHITRLKYFGQGEVAERAQPDGTTVRYQYDTEEKLIGVTNERGQTYHLVRDELGRVVEEIDYWGQKRTYKRDAVGNLLWAVDPLGRKTEYQVDPLGRMVGKIHFDSKEEAFEYDPNGNLIATENEHGRVERIFDPDNRMVEEKQGDLAVISEYDPAGNRTRRISPHGNEVAYGYDRLGNVMEIAINNAKPIKIHRDARGIAIHETLTDKVHRSFEYDPDGLLLNQHVQADQRTIVNRRYKYDAVGNLTQKTDSNKGSTTFTYDPMSRIIKHLNPEGQIQRFLHDPAGDLLQQVGGDAERGERICQYNDATYRFDAAGNLIERTNKTKGHMTFEWDGNNRLIAAQNGSPNRTTMGYDPLARRVFKETAKVRTQFVWDRDFLLSDQAGEEEGPREFVFYPDSFEPLAIINSDKTVYYYQNDLVGLPNEVTDTSGEIVLVGKLWDIWK